MNKVLSLTFAVLIVFVSCHSSDDSSDEDNFSNRDELELKLITGISARSSEFGESLLLGNPNIKEGDIVMFANPAINFLSIKSFSSVTDIWFVKGNPEKKYKNIDFETVLNSDLYSESEISSNSKLSLTELSGTNINVNLEDLSFGYYKVFVKTNGIIFWNNVYVGNDKEIDDFINFWK